MSVTACGAAIAVSEGSEATCSKSNAEGKPVVATDEAAGVRSAFAAAAVAVAIFSWRGLT